MQTISLTKLDDTGWQKYFLMKQEILKRHYPDKYSGERTWQECKVDWVKNYEDSKIFHYNEKVIIKDGAFTGWVDHSFDRRFAGFSFDAIEDPIGVDFIREVLAEVHIFMKENNFGEAGHWTFSSRKAEALRKINIKVHEELMDSILTREDMDPDYYNQIVSEFKHIKEFSGKFFNEIPAEYMDKYVSFVNERFDEMDNLNPCGAESPKLEKEDWIKYFEIAEKRGSLFSIFLVTDLNKEIAALCSVFADSFNKETIRHIGGFTAVAGNHRGRGLAKFMKAKMYLKLLDENKDFKNIVTDTMPWNKYMYKVNRDFGFKSNKYGCNFLITKEFLENYLNKC